MGEAKNAARGAASALSFLPPGVPMADWVLPWHRIRLENGHLKSRDRGEIVDPGDPANELFIAEGGRLIGGAAPQGRRYPLAAKGPGWRDQSLSVGFHCARRPAVPDYRACQPQLSDATALAEPWRLVAPCAMLRLLWCGAE